MGKSNKGRRIGTAGGGSSKVLLVRHRKVNISGSDMPQLSGCRPVALVQDGALAIGHTDMGVLENVTS